MLLICYKESFLFCLYKDLVIGNHDHMTVASNLRHFSGNHQEYGLPPFPLGWGVKATKHDKLCTNDEERFIDETTTARRTAPRLAESFTFIKHETTRTTASGLH